MHRLRVVLRRGGLVVFGLVLALLVAEVLLQLGAWAVRTQREPPMAWAGGGRRIACLGDSNTYGLYLERPQAYPAVLQRQWDARPDLPPIEVLNLGVPGTNSSKLRARFGEIMDALHPGVVLLMIGVNNAWTVPVPLHAWQTPLQRLWARSRVFRLLYMVRRAFANRAVKVAVDFSPVGRPRPMGQVRVDGEAIDLAFTGRATSPHDWVAGLRADLLVMVEQASAAGARPFLLTYPSETAAYGAANRVIRAVAAESGTPLINVGRALRAACQADGCDGLFLPDQHASARGNEIVAATVLEHLAR
jgi:hypothetical protein